MHAPLTLPDAARLVADAIAPSAGMLGQRAIAATESALKLGGNHGYSRANPLERHYRNVLCGRIHSPQEDSARQQAGRLALTISTKGQPQ